MGHRVMQLRQVQLRQVTLVQARVHGMLHGIVGNAAASGELPGVATRTSRSNWFAALIISVPRSIPSENDA